MTEIPSKGTQEYYLYRQTFYGKFKCPSCEKRKRGFSDEPPRCPIHKKTMLMVLECMDARCTDPAPQHELCHLHQKLMDDETKAREANRVKFSSLKGLIL